MYSKQNLYIVTLLIIKILVTISKLSIFSNPLPYWAFIQPTFTGHLKSTKEAYWFYFLVYITLNCSEASDKELGETKKEAMNDTFIKSKTRWIQSLLRVIWSIDKWQKWKGMLLDEFHIKPIRRRVEVPVWNDPVATKQAKKLKFNLRNIMN